MLNTRRSMRNGRQWSNLFATRCSVRMMGSCVSKSKAPRGLNLHSLACHAHMNCGTCRSSCVINWYIRGRNAERRWCGLYKRRFARRTHPTAIPEEPRAFVRLRIMCVSCDVLCGMQWIWIGDGIGTVPQSHGYILVLTYTLTHIIVLRCS